MMAEYAEARWANGALSALNFRKTCGRTVATRRPRSTA